MIQRLSCRLRAVVDGDRQAGLTLVEVIVAMMVFAIISVGVAFSITNALVLTRESRARAIASNLAAQDIDLVRATTNVFKVDKATSVKTVSGITFTVTRTVDWVDSTASVTDCGTGTGTLQYKAVTVRVKYDGQRTSTADVVNETLLAPGDRINDPLLGTIVVQVTGASGSGTPGVAVSISPAASPNGAAAPGTPAPTDGQGCAYALRVAPGNYDVSISKPNNVDLKRVAAPVTTPVVVTAGASASAAFTFDEVGTYTMNYASNYPGAKDVLLPSNLDTSFISTLTGVVTLPTAANNPAKLFPVGYTVVAGGYVAPVKNDAGKVTNSPCVDVDPASWAPTPGNGIAPASVPVAALPGGSAKVDVPMGVVRLPKLGPSTTVMATSVSTTANGDPGCATSRSYTFTTAGDRDVALPFGTWKLSTVVLDAGVLTLQTPVKLDAGALRTRGVVDAASGAVTLDPRPAA